LALAVISRKPQPVFELTFSEPVQGLLLDSLSHSGTATGCRFSMSSVLPGLTYRVSATNCSAGTVVLEVPAGVVLDATGNLGPSSSVSSEAVTLEKAASTGTTVAAALRPAKELTKRVQATLPAKESKPLVFAKPSVVSGKKAKPAAPSGSNLAEQVTVGDPVNRSLGFGALGAAVLIAGLYGFRRLRH
jgi:hypothetical protein